MFKLGERIDNSGKIRGIQAYGLNKCIPPSQSTLHEYQKVIVLSAREQKVEWYGFGSARIRIMINYYLNYRAQPNKSLHLTAI